MTHTRVTKCLKTINIKLGLHPAFFTFHSMHRSGATFAYKDHVPIQEIMHQGTWSLEYLWLYIQTDHKSAENLVDAMHNDIYT